MNYKVKQPDEHLGFLLTQVSFLKQRIINAALKEIDITYIQFVILAGVLELGEQEEFISQQTIASKRRLDKAMVSTVVKSLIARKLMLRQPHPADKRAYILSLTAEGETKALRGKEIALEIDKKFFVDIMDNRYLLKIFKKLLLNNEE